jgi:hopanoid biosynthesis associated protein HpnK
VRDTRLIITADDFGRAEAINEAVERGHRDGVLTAASLMVTGAAVDDAVERARRLPGLGTGLHVTLVDGIPVLPPEQIPDLVEADGRFTRRLVALGARIYLSPRVRRQVAAELRAQFELYRATGLALDHVDSHHHYHLHPTVFALMVPLAREYGARGVRIPFEPPLASWRARRDRPLARLAAAAFHLRRAARMRALVQAHGMVANDAMFGLHDSGGMDASRLAAYVGALPPGLNEAYCHPGAHPWLEAHPMPPSYRPVDEFRALVDPAIAELVAGRGILLTTFGREAA